MNELRRILSDKKRLIIYIAVPLICIALFFLERLNNDIKNGWKWLEQDTAKYQQDVQKYCTMEPTDALAAMEQDGYQAGFMQETNLKTAAEHVQSYKAYLEGVHKNALKMAKSSIFGKDRDSFTYKNIQKTDADFVALDGIELEFGNDRAVDTWLKFTTSDILYLVVIIITVMAFFEDKKNGLCSIVRSTPKGRLNLALSRLFILIGISAVFTLLINAGVLGSSFALYGGMDGLGRAVQSMEAFKTCTLHTSILGWILIYLGAKIACGVLIGLIFWFVLSFVSNIQLSWFIVIAILAVEFAAYKLINEQLQFSFFKYVNLFSYVYPTEILSKYLNMNVFNEPVGVFPLLRRLMIILFAALTAAVLLLQVRRHPLGNRNILGKFVVFWNRICDFFRRKMHIPGFEGYKLLILAGSIIFLAAGIYFGGKLRYKGWEYQEQDYVYLQYLKDGAAGEINEETEEYLAKARQNLEAHEDIAYQFEGSLMRIESEAAKAKENGEQKGFTPWLVNQTDVNNLLGQKTWSLTRWNAIVALAFQVLLIAPLFAIEKRIGTEKLLRSTAGGRSRVFRGKYAILTLETAAIWCGVYLREWLAVRKEYADVLACPIQNFRIFENFPVVMSFASFLILLYLLRFVGMMIASLILAYISSRVNTWEKAVMLGAGVLLIPAALLYFGQEWAGNISVLPNIALAEILVPHIAFGTKEIIASVMLLISAALTFLVYRGWTKSVRD